MFEPTSNDMKDASGSAMDLGFQKYFEILSNKIDDIN